MVKKITTCKFRKDSKGQLDLKLTFEHKIPTVFPLVCLPGSVFPLMFPLAFALVLPHGGNPCRPPSRTYRLGAFPLANTRANNVPPW